MSFFGEEIERDLPGGRISSFTGKPTVWNPRTLCPECGVKCWDWFFYQEPCGDGWLQLPIVPFWRLLLGGPK